jgi:hypothetical protein
MGGVPRQLPHEPTSNGYRYAAAPVSTTGASLVMTSVCS